MCLAVPGQVTRISGKTSLVDFGGVQREILLDLLDDVAPGDWVLAHAGFAIQKVDAEEAASLLQMFSEIDALNEETGS